MKGEFTVERDSLDIKKYTIRPKEKIEPDRYDITQEDKIALERIVEGEAGGESFVVFLIFLHLWMDWGHQIFNDPPPHKHAVDFVENHKAWFFSIRDIFNMTFAAAMAAMLRLSENWHKSEVARQEAEKERTQAELSRASSAEPPRYSSPQRSLRLG